MTGLLVVAGGVSVWHSTDDGVDKKTGSLVEKAQEGKLKDFYEFRRRYIVVYLVIMLADWMQGTVSFFTFVAFFYRRPTTADRFSTAIFLSFIHASII
jgi:type II secretory pathway component PulK